MLLLLKFVTSGWVSNIDINITEMLQYLDTKYKQIYPVLLKNYG